MKRREFITLLGGAAAALLTCPLVLHAQQPARGLRIGVLMSLAQDDRQGQRYVAAFLNRLQELGWKDAPGLASSDGRTCVSDRDQRRPNGHRARQAGRILPAKLLQPVQECRDVALPLPVILGEAHQHANPQPARGLLRVEDERTSKQRGRRAAEERDELAPFHCPMPPVLPKG